MLKVAFAVKGLQRIAGIEFPGAEKGPEAERVAVRVVKQRQHKTTIVACQHAGIVIAFGDQPFQFFILRGERDGMGQHVRRHKGVYRLVVFFKRNTAIAVVQIQHRVEGVEIRRSGG